MMNFSARDFSLLHSAVHQVALPSVLCLSGIPQSLVSLAALSHLLALWCFYRFH